MNYDVNLDEGLTLFVGKNNAGKTSLMNLMDMVVSGRNLTFNDYPIPCVRIFIKHLLIFGVERFRLRIVSIGFLLQ